MQRQFDFLVSSNPELGAINRSADGSRFSIQLENSGFGIPSNAQNVTVSVMGGELWYNTRNIDSTNNAFSFTIGSGADSTTYVAYITPGLYSADTIWAGILRAIKRDTTAPSVPFTIVGDEAVGKMVVKVNDGTSVIVSIDFTSPNSIGTVLGFTAVVYPNATINPEFPATVGPYIIGTEEPKFNSFNYYLVQSDIVGNGIRIGSSFNTIIAKIMVSANPNRQLLYEPTNPTLVNASNLAGDGRRMYSFSLLDDSLKPVDTRGEYYSMQLRVSYFD